MTLDPLHALEMDGKPSQYVCPEYQGTLFELEEEQGISHFRCYVGHATSVETLASKQEEELETALWIALRAIEEHSLLLQRMIGRSEQRGLRISVGNYRSKLAEGTVKAGIIRRALEVQPDAHKAISEEKRNRMTV
ncbi:hypothetical protein BH11ARM2_BH11ARM2_03100 [soil metagenome]